MEALSKRDAESRPVDDWVSLPKAASLLGVSPLTVLSMALDGQLTRQKVDGRWFFTRASIDAARAALAQTA